MSSQTSRGLKTWPLYAIGAPAAVAIWSGWIGLGTLCGFGDVAIMPGVLPWHINTAITLPVGVEAYAAYSLGAWLHGGHVSQAARRFAKRSAIGALVLGAVAQCAYHLLEAAHATRAPAPVVVIVACIPVATLGMAAALTHLMRSEGDQDDVPEVQTQSVLVESAEPAPEVRKQPVPEVHQEVVPELAAEVRPRRTHTRAKARTRRVPVSHEAAEEEFMSELATGTVPSIREIRDRLHVGQPRATELQKHLYGVSESQNIQRGEAAIET
jgi:hypothetical protein